MSEPASDAPSLPDFTDPPVVEVVLSVGFLPLRGLHSGMIGKFWSEALRSSFPYVEEQPPYDMPVEPPAGGVVAQPAFHLQQGFPPPRLWCRDESGTQMVQIQRNWFAFNWQDAGGENDYPRYGVVEEHFLRHLLAFVAFLEHEEVGDVAPVQCEVTYINHIVLPGPGHAGAEDLLSIVGRGNGQFLPAAEGVQVSTSYPILTADGSTAGRLHIAAFPAFIGDAQEPMVRLNVTARGYPQGEGEGGIVDFLRLGREWVVRGFADVTTSEAQSMWGRRG